MNKFLWLLLMAVAGLAALDVVARKDRKYTMRYGPVKLNYSKAPDKPIYGML